MTTPKKVDAPDSERILFTIPELAAATGFSVATIERRVKDGTIPVFRELGGVRIPRAAFERFVNARTRTEGPAAKQEGRRA